MKTCISLLCLCLMFSCSPTTSTETTLQDTTATATLTDTASLVISKTSEPVFSIADSAAVALKAIVDSKFETMFQALADSANYYKVVYEDYFDEWEGQAEMKRTTWFFDKELNAVYIKFSYENGAMEKPDVSEYLATNNIITAARNESDFETPRNRAFTVWSAETDGLVVNWSSYSEEAESIEPLPKDFAKDSQGWWDSYMDDLKSLTNDEEHLIKGDDVYTILVETPKPAELMDYTKLIIPKAVYDKVRAEE